MVSSLNTSTNNVYSIMNSPGQASANVDDNKALNTKAQLQQQVQEVEQSRSKGSTDSYRQTLKSVNLLV